MAADRDADVDAREQRCHLDVRKHLRQTEQSCQMSVPQKKLRLESHVVRAARLVALSTEGAHVELPTDEAHLEAAPRGDSLVVIVQGGEAQLPP